MPEKSHPYHSLAGRTPTAHNYIKTAPAAVIRTPKAMSAKVTCEKCKELVPREYTVACDVCHMRRPSSLAVSFRPSSARF